MVQKLQNARVKRRGAGEDVQQRITLCAKPEIQQLWIEQRVRYGRGYADEVLEIPVSDFPVLVRAMMAADRQGTVDAVANAFISTAPANRNR